MVPFFPGNNENNILIGSVGNDAIQGYGGDDSLYGGLGNDSLVGGFGNDLIADDDGGRDILVGGSGNDYLQVRDQAGDTLFGGAGDDIAYIDRREITTPLSFAFNERTGVGSSFNDGTELYGIERLYLYSGAGNDTGTIVLDGISNGSMHRSQVGFGGGIDLLRINLEAFVSGIEMSAVPFTPGSNVRFTASGVEMFSALSVEYLSVSGSRADDYLYGLSRADTISGNDGNDILQGEGGKDLLYGGIGNDELYGGAGDDEVSGGNGNDTLTGAAGRDTLTGGAGQDTFFFRDALERRNVDRILDFDAAEDVFLLDAAAFTGLSSAGFDPSAFVANLTGTARSAEHRIMYETDTGRLFFDPDGTGSSVRSHFATLSAGLVLSSLDFLVI